MALKPAEQAKFDGLNQTVGILHSLGHDKETIQSQVAPIAKAIEEATNSKLDLVYENEVPAFILIDLKSDFVRTRSNTENTMLSLRAKIFGLPIEVKVMKESDGIKASNKDVSIALTELAAIVDSMEEEMVAKGHADWPRTPGEKPAVEEEEPSDIPEQDLGDEDDDLIDAIEETDDSAPEKENPLIG